MVEIGVDIGGTFTDVVAWPKGAAPVHVKVPSTPDDLVRGVREGVLRALDDAGAGASDVTRLVHGSTVATNAVLERKGARTGVLMTAGFEDTLDIGREQRRNLFDLFVEGQTPGFLAARRHRVGIAERVASDGKVLVPLDEEQVRGALRSLVESGIEAIAVCYLFSFVNPDHELRTREIAAEEIPGLRVSLSSEIDPQFREYERLVVTALDAYLRAKIDDYVGRLEADLAESGIVAPLQIMQSRGGIQTARAAIERPVTMLLSGLAAGVVGGRHEGQRARAPNLITVDIGGTSCDVALVKEGKPLIATSGSIGGFPVRLQTVDVSTVGAGGGSIAWIDDAGGLRVGPQSAGAEPGPACYGRGGSDATVTDASVVLGYLNPKRLAGGQLTLNEELAHAAVGRIASRLELDVPVAASGIHAILNSRMAAAIRLVSLQRGYDHRNFPLLALGGAGPVHCAALMSELSMPRTIVPAAPGVLSAFGLLVSDVEHEQFESFQVAADEIDDHQLRAAFDSLNALGTAKADADGLRAACATIRQFAEMRYVGQSYELSVELPGPSSASLLPESIAAFHDIYERRYGHCDRAASVEFVGLRTVHSFGMAQDTRRAAPITSSVEHALIGERDVWCSSGQKYRPTPIYDRSLLPAEATIVGPAIVEQPDTTLVVGLGQQLTVLDSGPIVVEETSA